MVENDSLLKLNKWLITYSSLSSKLPQESVHHISDLCQCRLCNDIITTNRAGIENLSDIGYLPFLADPAEMDDGATSPRLDSLPLEFIDSPLFSILDQMGSPCLVTVCSHDYD
uniref:Uncharacterized protein n=1 Tax=Micrurus corallinus TaxID=54390 RepID=A0A2D4EPN9_MICCO